MSVALVSYGYATSAPLHLMGADGEVLRKDLSPASVLPRARGAKPSFLRDPRREIAVYRDVLPPWLGSPRFVDAVEEADEDRYWLFLERVAGLELWQVGELEVWAGVARWLATMHDARLHLAAPPDVARLLVRYDGDHLRAWAGRARDIADDGTSSTRTALQRILRHHDQLVELLLALPQTFVHGELYPSNVLVAGRRVAVVDWETAGVGPALVDLAALSEGWDEAARARLVAAYREASTEPAAVTAVGLDACRLHLCIRWLGWARGWTPPDEHRRDWMAEALDLTERLGL